MADSGPSITIKPEIKLDTGDGDGNINDIEQYVEDVEELDMPKPGEEGQAWLVNMPPAVWSAWNEMYKGAPSDQEIVIGKMRVYDVPGVLDPMKQKLRIILNEQYREHHGRRIAAEYDVQLKSVGYSNVVVFSEKDQPGHRPNNFGAHRRGVQPKADRYAQNRKPGGFRTAIPKKTALAPPIQHEATATPVATKDYDDLAQAMQAEKDKTAKVLFQPNLARTIHPGMAGQPMFAIGSLTSKPGKGNRKKIPKEKTVRIEKDQLLDQLQSRFREYKYWSLRSLRNALQQPEAYIKQTLEEIAVLVKSGDFANTYRLKPEYQNLADANLSAGRELAPEVKSEAEMITDLSSDEGDGLGDDGFEDVEMT